MKKKRQRKPKKNPLSKFKRPLLRKTKFIDVSPDVSIVAGYEDLEEEKPIYAAWLGSPADAQLAPSGPESKIFEKLSSEILSPDEDRSKVITLHLFVEYWLEKIISRVGIKDPDRFKFRVDRLREYGSFSIEQYDNLVAINNLRNIYAHELDLEKAHEEVKQNLAKMTLDPYFMSNDGDLFRRICTQTMFQLETVFNHNGKPPARTFPHEDTKKKLLAEGRLHWQDCELLKKVQTSYYCWVVTLRCPLCGTGTIEREKDDTPGYRESSMGRCAECGLSGDGNELLLKTAK